MSGSLDSPPQQLATSCWMQAAGVNVSPLLCPLQTSANLPRAASSPFAACIMLIASCLYQPNWFASMMKTTSTYMCCVAMRCGSRAACPVGGWDVDDWVQGWWRR